MDLGFKFKMALVIVGTATVSYALLSTTIGASFLEQLFLDEMLLKTLVVVLLAVVVVLAIGICVMPRQKIETQVITTEASPSNDEQRGRGRPHKPCALAQLGVMPCPLMLEYVASPEQIERVATKAAQLLLEKAIKPAKSEPEVKKLDKKTEKSPEKKGEKTTEDTKEATEGLGSMLEENAIEEAKGSS